MDARYLAFTFSRTRSSISSGHLSSSFSASSPCASWSSADAASVAPSCRHAGSDTHGRANGPLASAGPRQHPPVAVPSIHRQSGAVPARPTDGRVTEGRPGAGTRQATDLRDERHPSAAQDDRKPEAHLPLVGPEREHHHTAQVLQVALQRGVALFGAQSVPKPALLSLSGRGHAVYRDGGILQRSHQGAAQRDDVVDVAESHPGVLGGRGRGGQGK